MRNRRELWLLHQTAATYSCRPSALVGLDEDTWLAYQVDVAALLLGQRVASLTEDGRLSVSAALDRLEAERPAAGGYRDPRPMVSRVMAVPESGVW